MLPHIARCVNCINSIIHKQLALSHVAMAEVTVTADCVFWASPHTDEPRVWNCLPTDLWQPDLSYSRFRQSLKTFIWSVGSKRFNYFTYKAVTYLLTSFQNLKTCLKDREVFQPRITCNANPRPSRSLKSSFDAHSHNHVLKHTHAYKASE